jgi:hypothetical protein
VADLAEKNVLVVVVHFIKFVYTAVPSAIVRFVNGNACTMAGR